MRNEHDANEALARSAGHYRQTYVPPKAADRYRQTYVPPKAAGGIWSALAALAACMGAGALFAALLVQWLCTGGLA